MQEYQGRPVYHPTVSLFDDSDLPNASTFQPSGKVQADNSTYLFAHTSSSARNWPGRIQTWANAVPEAGASYPFAGLRHPPVWDGCFGRWIVTTNVSGTPNLYDGYTLASYDGITWDIVPALLYNLGITVYGNPQGAIVRPTDGAVLLVGPNGLCNPGILLGSASGFGGVTLGDAGAGNWYSGAWFNNQWVVWRGGSTLTAWYATGTVMTVAATWAPPSGFTIHNQAHVVTATQILLFPAGAWSAPPSSTSEYMSTSDGENWTPQMLPTLNAGESVVDACYDALQEVYYLVTSTSSVARVWSSETGAAGSWTVVATLGHQLYALRASDGELLAWLSSDETPSTLVYRAIQSTDGGVTWRYTSLLSSTAPGEYFSLHANGAQFLYCNTSEFASSLTVGATPVVT